jgi:aryl-alcohol dehydrogenase-like predicted oxidoreductase
MALVVESRPLGRTGIRVPALGVGTNRWGAAGKDADAIAPLFSAALDAGANLIDTAEMYQMGKSEQVIGELMRRDNRPAVVVSKFAPYPTRWSSKTLAAALDASLERLGASTIDLYLVHWPFTFLRIGAMIDRIAEAVGAGKVRAVGVSNFGARHMHLAAERLAKHGLPLAANEVSYSLLKRGPERNGVLAACRELDTALIAYRPLAGGRIASLSGALGQALRDIAAALKKTPSQVALSWLIHRDPRVIAIPGATSVGHLRENCDPLSWTLTEAQRATLDRASA